MTWRLFVYGTLRENSRNDAFHLLTRHATFVGRARMKGRLYDLGEYPGLVASSGADAWVRGELYSLEKPEEALSRLDCYEGCGPDAAKPHDFKRVELDAELETGETIRAWVYVYEGSIEGKHEITSGDYLEDDF